MSEDQSYSTQIKVEMVGLDTARYAIVSTDSVVTLDITTNGYRTLVRHLNFRNSKVVVDMSRGHLMKDRAAIAMTAVIEEVRRQFDIPNTIPVTSRLDSVRVYYSERVKKGFVPQLRHVDFSFSDGYGLSGQPYLLQDTVWLYGSAASLSKINSLETSKTHFDQIHSTDTFKIPLKPVWEKYPDLRTSTESISLVVPACAYSEHELELPVHTDVADTSIHVRLYPDHVRVWVLSPIMEDQEEINPDQIRCSIGVDVGSDRAHVNVNRFPSHLRIKKIEPETIQYVIIR